MQSSLTCVAQPVTSPTKAEGQIINSQIQLNNPVSAGIVDRLPDKHFGNFSKHARRDSSQATIKFGDFRNPWTFYSFFSGSQLDILRWFQGINLLKSDLVCSVCDGVCRMSKRERNVDGYTYRCETGQHEFSVRSGSIFSNFHYSLGDVVMFILNLLQGDTLKQNAGKIGLNYKMAAPRWAKIIREVMAERVWNEYFATDTRVYKFSCYVQADESKFGRKVKHNTGSPRGRCVWLVGLFESDSGRLLLLPVVNR